MRGNAQPSNPGIKRGETSCNDPHCPMKEWGNRLGADPSSDDWGQQQDTSLLVITPKPDPGKSVERACENEGVIWEGGGNKRRVVENPAREVVRAMRQWVFKQKTFKCRGNQKGAQ